MTKPLAILEGILFLPGLTPSFLLSLECSVSVGIFRYQMQTRTSPYVTGVT